MKRLLVCLIIVALLAPAAVLAQDGGDLLVPPGESGEYIYIPFPVAITLDGDVSEWEGVPAFTVTKGPNTSSDPAENGSFTFAAAADAEKLYITMSMPDKTIIAGQHGQDFWNEDSLEFFLNVSGDLYSPVFRDGIYQININAADIGNTDPDGLTLTGVRSGTLPVSGFVFETANGWGFEAAVPLAALNIEAAHGAEIGFQTQANGASIRDRNVQLVWSNADTNNASYQNPGVFGRAIFFEIGQTDLPLPSAPPEPEGPIQFDMGDINWKEMVRATWEGYKANYITCGEACGGNLGLVFDPNIGYQAVSEGVGYGLLMAVMMDDQPTFDTIYDAAHAIMLDTNTGLFHWRVDNTGAITGSGSATDAEEDIALALIFAQQRVAQGAWTQHETRPYGDRANELIDAIYTYEVIEGRYLKPGNEWGGREIINLSYFAPAWYRIFDQFQGTDRWRPVITYGYRTLFVTEGASRGLAPDWSTVEGEPAFEYCDRVGRPREQCSYDMGYDAIRVPWRIGLDCLWFQDQRACQWSQRTAQFLNSLPPEDFALMYDISGTPTIGTPTELTIGMWLVAALASGDGDLQARLAQMLYTYGSSAESEGYWGGSAQYYFNQSLAWFGAALLSGDFQNLYPQP